MKIPDFLRVYVAVGQPYPDTFQLILASIDISIALSLGKMDGNRLLHFVNVPVGSLDFIDCNSICLCAILIFLDNHAVRPSFHTDNIVGRFIQIAQKNLRMIISSHFSLNHTMDSSALLHGIIGKDCSPVVDIPGTQNEFHQVPD